MKTLSFLFQFIRLLSKMIMYNKLNVKNKTSSLMDQMTKIQFH